MKDFHKESKLDRLRSGRVLLSKKIQIASSALLVLLLLLGALAKLYADEVSFGSSQTYTITNTNQDLTLLIYDARAIYSTDPTYTTTNWFEETHYYGWLVTNDIITGNLVENGACLYPQDYVTFEYTHYYEVDYDGDGYPDDFYYEPLTLMPNESFNLPYWSDFTYPNGGDTFTFVMFQVDSAWGPPPPCTNSTLSQSVQCGSLASEGVLSSTNIQVCVNGSVTPPTVSGTTVYNGVRQVVVSNCISGIISTSYFPITYTFGPLEFDPPMTGPFDSLGSYSYSAQITATPSDTNCSPFVISVGTVNVEVVNTAATNVTVQCGDLLTPGTINASNMWVCLNGSVAAPETVDLPVFTNGTIVTTG